MLNIPKRLLLLIIMFLLNGCSGSASMPISYYLLAEVERPVTTQLLPETTQLEIASFNLASYLDRQNITYRTNPYQLRFSESEQWGGSLRKQMQRIVTSYLSNRFSNLEVMEPPRRSTAARSLKLSLDVTNFALDSSSSVQLQILWSLSSGQKRQTFVTNLQQPVSNPGDTTAVVAAMSEVYGQFCQLVAKQLQQQ